jgi:hypothetical protein
VLDANKGVVVTPNVVQHEFSTWAEDLRAQVSGATVATYTWDLSQAPDAVSVSGLGTYRLQFTWASFTGAARTDTIKLTTTNTDGSQQVQTLTFRVNGTDSPAWTSTPPTTASTWPTVVTPDQITNAQQTIDWNEYSLGLATGELRTAYQVFGYKEDAPLVLDYNSAVAHPQPTFLERFALSPTQPVPATVSARLTFNGVPGPDVYYNTALLNPGDIMQIALQADASTLPTGRYNWQIDTTVHSGSPVTTTQSGQVNIINDQTSVFGAGWSLEGAERLWPVAGGVILEQASGQSLWFANGPAGSFLTPVGDFSTLVQTSGGGYTRTLPEGTSIQYNPVGLELSRKDLNNNSETFIYARNTLVGLGDPTGLPTQFVLDAYNRAYQIVDPASCTVATLAHNLSGDLTSATDTAGVQWQYTYNSDRMSSLANPWTVSYFPKCLPLYCRNLLEELPPPNPRAQPARREDLCLRTNPCPRTNPAHPRQSRPCHRPRHHPPRPTPTLPRHRLLPYRLRRRLGTATPPATPCRPGPPAAGAQAPGRAASAWHCPRRSRRP